MAEPKGKYVKRGDVEEWVWDEDGPGTPKLTGGWVVPEGEFDPKSAPSDTKAPSELVAEAAKSQGLRVAEMAEPEEEPAPAEAPERRGPGRPKKTEA
jgi:hypothetical protein